MPKTIVDITNCLATTHPKLAKQWHPTKNRDLTPFDIYKGSHKKVWWKCPQENDHEWEAIIYTRVNGAGCPCCIGRKLVPSNSLKSKYPHIAKQWHPTRNINLKPSEVYFGTYKKVWWKCNKENDHEWFTSIRERTIGKTNCPCCSGRKVVRSNSLGYLNPKLSEEWHPTKNGNLTPFEVGKETSKKVWWKCHKGSDHEWLASVKNRSSGNGCPCCMSRKIVKSNCLATTHPKLAKQWHPTKNGSLSPFDVAIDSLNEVWWKCNKAEDHVWKSRINSRKKSPGCSVCRGLTVVNSNSLFTLEPGLSMEWHPTKNGNLTPKDFVCGSKQKVWWKCIRGDNHEWEAVIHTRTSGIGCPFCTLTPQSRQELIITHELITIFKGINPKGFKTRVKGKLRSIDIYIPDLKLGIEFDGSHWHKDKRALDKLKTEELEAEGFNIIRVRQKPLKRIFEDDVMAEKKYDGKKITNDILIQIMKDYKLGQSTILKINKYIEKPNLQNEKGLEKYIDMILTEKAEKK